MEWRATHRVLSARLFAPGFCGASLFNREMGIGYLVKSASLKK
jgi:hypothetical protein